MHAEIRSAYLAPEGLEATLAESLARAGAGELRWHGRLALSAAPPLDCPWAQDIWMVPALHAVASVKDASDVLRGMQRNWSAYAAGHHRRMALIEARLPPVKAAPLVFPAPAPAAHLGAWTLLEPGLLLASPVKSSPVPNGEWRFVEDHIGPPSRAYLKLWEALTRLGARPGPGDTCLDLGASPGGWTWVLARLGAGVTGVDKAPLDPRVAALPGVTQSIDSAFALEPRPVDWLVCDVIAYPARTLAMLERWLPLAGGVVCTVKFQGATDHDAVDGIRTLAGAQAVHLFHNKHELTVLRGPAASG
ncbi:MAG: SAM-dependent methyltransferase [Janthinobacterium lividum]